MPPLESITRLVSSLDGCAVLALGVAFTVAAAWRLSRGDPPWARWGLAAATLAGLAARLWLSVDAPMNAWAYQRRLPLAVMIYEGPALRALSSQWRWFTPHLTDVISATNLCLAAITPAVYFSHARYLLKDARAAVAAAAFIALLPLHVRFSRSDVQFVFSLVTSSMTFVVLYGALSDPSPRWRALCFALLPVACGATYFARPENISFAALDAGALLLYLRADVPRRRWLLAGAVMGLAAAFALAAFTLQNYRGDLQRGLDVQTLTHAWTVLWSPRLNTMVNPHMTPPLVPALAALGLVALARRGELARAAFLVAWLSGFFVIHSYVRTSVPEMEARYHLQLVTPLVFMAAAAVPWLWSLRRELVAAAAAWMLLAPWLHRDFIRDARFSEMEEYRFLRALRGRIPAGCRVLEFTPPPSLLQPDMPHPSRVNRLTTRLVDRFPYQAAEVIRADEAATGRDEHAAEGLSPTARALASGAEPVGCLYLYEGLTCYAQRPTDRALAPVCTALREAFTLEPVASLRTAARYYDDPNSGRIVAGENGETRVIHVLRDGDPLTFTLYRVRGRRGP
ncbi:MAG: hypothetical protein U0325_27355 [Polyangiales bacterium]